MADIQHGLKERYFVGNETRELTYAEAWQIAMKRDYSSEQPIKLMVDGWTQGWRIKATEYDELFAYCPTSEKVIVEVVCASSTDLSELVDRCRS